MFVVTNVNLRKEKRKQYYLKVKKSLIKETSLNIYRQSGVRNVHPRPFIFPSS